MSPRKHDVPDELLSRLLANYQKPEDLIGENGLLKRLTKLLVEKALDAEMFNRAQRFTATSNNDWYTNWHTRNSFAQKRP